MIQATFMQSFVHFPIGSVVCEKNIEIRKDNKCRRCQLRTQCDENALYQTLVQIS